MNSISGCSFSAQPTPPGAVPLVGANGKSGSQASRRCLHRLGEVRRREKFTYRRVARCLGVSVSEVKRQEEQSSDLSLSELYRWQAVLGVPLGDLLREPEYELSPPVRLRARLTRLMKTVRSIQAATRQASIQRLSTMLAEQLLDIMPELEGTVSWPTGDHRYNDPIEPINWRLFCKGRVR
jgi:transcriptional regulator with XRE-family HTH domain